MLTPFYPFSWKWEESALQFYDLIPLGKNSVTPGMSNAQGMENRKYALVHSVSVSLYLCLCIRVTNTYTKIFVCTLKYLCMWVFVTPECCPLLKKSKNSLLLYLSSPCLSATLFTCSSYCMCPSWAEWSATVCTEWVSRWEKNGCFRLSTGWAKPSSMMSVEEMAGATYKTRLQTVRRRSTEAFSPLMYIHEYSGLKSRALG